MDLTSNQRYSTVQLIDSSTLKEKQMEFYIIRNNRTPNLYDVVQADFKKGTVKHLMQAMPFDQATESLEALRNSVNQTEEV
jgi:hypothetical protein